MARSRRHPTADKLLRPRSDNSPPYERIQQAIVSGEFAPGQALVETTLAAWCEVSRTPIREALLRLEHDGLVVRTERGIIVRERSPEEILDIYETRIVLEVMAARTAAERRTGFDILTLRRQAKIFDRVDATVERDLVNANRAFHRAVWRAGHNEPLIDLLMRLELHPARYPATTLSYPGRWKNAGAQHRALADAIERSDQAAAAAVAEEHFADARDIRLAIWRNSI